VKAGQGKYDDSRADRGHGQYVKGRRRPALRTQGVESI
jgi:hypothetical protein